MSPTNLGALPGVEVAPTGLTQNKRGVAQTTITWNNTVTFGTSLQDGAGGNMFIQLTTGPRRGWWVIHGQTMWLTDAPWASFEVHLFCTPADINGWSTFKVQHSMHAAVGWTTVSSDAVYLLEANTAYWCYLVWGYCSGYNWTYHCHPAYHYIEGEFIGEGRL